MSKKKRSSSMQWYDECFEGFDYDDYGSYDSGFESLSVAEKHKEPPPKKKPEVEIPDPFTDFYLSIEAEDTQEKDPWAEDAQQENGQQKSKGGIIAACLAAVLLLVLAAGAAMMYLWEPNHADPASQTVPAITDASQPPESVDPALPENTAELVLPVNTTAPETSAPTEALVEPELDVTYYARSQLDSEDQALYDRIYSAAMTMSTVPDIVNVDGDHIFALVEYVMIDHPELFWMDGAASISALESNGVTTTELTLNYTHTTEERAQVQEIVDAYCDRALSGLENLSGFEQVKGVYDYIIHNTNYEYDYDAQSLCDVVVNGKGVCAGYAKTTQYLLQQLGMEAMYVSGYADNESHAWNIIKVDGQYYQIDTTWGDPILEPGDEPSLNYNYFCLTSEEMYREHTPDMTISLPECTATACNYHVHEGRYFEVYDRSRILELLKRDVAARSEMEMRFANAQVYQEAFQNLITNEDIFNLMEECGLDGFDRHYYEYVYFEENYCLKFIFRYN